MAISIAEEPEDICMVRHPQWVKAVSDLYVVEINGGDPITFEFNRVATAGETIEVTIGTTVHLFTADATPDDSGYQFAIGANTNDQAEQFLLCINGNYYIDQSFITVRVVSTVGMYPKLEGNDWNLGAATVTASDLCDVSQTEPPDYTEYAEDFRLGVLVDVEPIPYVNYLRLPELVGVPVLDYNAYLGTEYVQVNIAPLLKPYVYPTWPTYGGAQVAVPTKLLCNFRVQVYERIAGVPKKLHDLGYKKAWYAGLRVRDRKSEFSVYNSHLLGGTFLTYRGRVDRMEVSPLQPVWLAWYSAVLYESEPRVDVYCKVYYTDGTDSGNELLYTQDQSTDFLHKDIVLWAAGFTSSGAAALDPSKTAYKYTFWLYSRETGLRISEVYTIHVVEEDTNEVWVEFVNSLGGIESLRCKGSWELGLNAESEELFQPLPIEPQPENASYRHEPRGHQEVLQVSTGFMDRYELAHILDIVNSPEIRLRDRARSRWLPVRLPGSTHVVKQQGTGEEHLYAANFEVLVGDPETVGSDRIALIAP